MGTFSEINLEQDYPESTGTAAFSSPFISNMTGGLQSPFISSGTHTAAPSPQQPSIQPEQAVTPAKEAAESKSADCQTVPESAEKNKAPQSGQNFAEQSADVTADEKTEEEKKKAHEAAEAKRKAEWEAKFAERRAKEKAEQERVAALSDDAVMAEAMKRVADGFERLTRRNMKDMVSEYVQTECLSDPALARNAMSPKKSMINCVKYINNKAREYIKQEMEDNDMKPENGIYGGDVPDDVVYQWAMDYFNDPNAKEDEVKEERFVPKPYISSTSSKAKKKEKDKEKEKKAEEKKAAAKKAAEEKAKQNADDGQLSLLGAVA